MKVFMCFVCLGNSYQICGSICYNKTTFMIFVPEAMNNDSVEKLKFIRL